MSAPFKPCEDCDSRKDCAYNEQCWFEHEFDRGAPGFNFTQEAENWLNDPRRGQGDK